MNATLQDRLVKELRLRGISNMDAANAFAPEFIEDYNRRFARPPANAHNAHRLLRAGEDLDRIFAWREVRTMTQNLVVHFKRQTFLVKPTPEALPGRGKRVDVREWEDGRIEVSFKGRALPYSVFDKNPQVKVAQGAVVENKFLDGALNVIRAMQEERDRQRLDGDKSRLTLRQKDRVRTQREAAGAGAAAQLSPGHAAAMKFLMKKQDDARDRKQIQNRETQKQRIHRLRDTLAQLPR